MRDEYIKKILAIEKRHLKKYGYRKMSIEELDRLCGLGQPLILSTTTKRIKK